MMNKAEWSELKVQHMVSMPSRYCVGRQVEKRRPHLAWLVPSRTANMGAAENAPLLQRRS